MRCKDCRARCSSHLLCRRTVARRRQSVNGTLTCCHTDMRDHFVLEPLISKRQQLYLATQLCRMVLKVCPALLRVNLCAESSNPNLVKINNVIIAGKEDDQGY